MEDEDFFTKKDEDQFAGSIAHDKTDDLIEKEHGTDGWTDESILGPDADTKETIEEEDDDEDFDPTQIPGYDEAVEAAKVFAAAREEEEKTYTDLLHEHTKAAIEGISSALN